MVICETEQVPLFHVLESVNFVFSAKLKIFLKVTPGENLHILLVFF